MKPTVAMTKFTKSLGIFMTLSFHIMSCQSNALKLRKMTLKVKMTLDIRSGVCMYVCMCNIYIYIIFFIYLIILGMGVLYYYLGCYLK